MVFLRCNVEKSDKSCNANLYQNKMLMLYETLQNNKQNFSSFLYCKIQLENGKKYRSKKFKTLKVVDANIASLDFNLQKENKF